MKNITYLLLISLVLALFIPLLTVAQSPTGVSIVGENIPRTQSEEPALQRNTETEAEAYVRRTTTQSTGPYFLVVPPAAFTSDGANPDAFRIDSGYGYLHGLYGTSNLWAPVYLPRDAVVNSLEVRLRDDDAHPGHDVCVYLDRMNLDSGEYECCLAEVCSNGGSGEYVVLVERGVALITVTDLQAYQLNVYGLYPETYIYGMRIGYAFQEHLPAIMGD